MWYLDLFITIPLEKNRCFCIPLHTRSAADREAINSQIGPLS